MTVTVLRPQPSEPVIAIVDCLPGEQPVGGGTTVAATTPNEDRFHLLSSGPTATGWMGMAAATARFSPGISLAVTATAFCGTP